MNAGEPSCDQSTLSRFLDCEVRPEGRSQIIRHLEQCRFCRHALKDHETISSLFKAHLAREVSRAEFESLEEEIIASLERYNGSWLKRVLGFVTSKRFYLPAAAITTALAVFVYLRGSSTPVSRPSAVINSFTGEISSVMVIETPKSHQTILWYRETTTSNEDDDGGQKS